MKSLSILFCMLHILNTDPTPSMSTLPTPHAFRFPHFRCEKRPERNASDWWRIDWHDRKKKIYFPPSFSRKFTPRARRLRTKQEAYGTSLENILVFDGLVQPVNDFLAWNTDESTHEWTLQFTGNSTSFFLGEEEGVRETPQRCS